MGKIVIVLLSLSFSINAFSSNLYERDRNWSKPVKEYVIFPYMTCKIVQTPMFDALNNPFSGDYLALCDYYRANLRERYVAEIDVFMKNVNYETRSTLIGGRLPFLAGAVAGIQRSDRSPERRRSKRETRSPPH